MSHVKITWQTKAIIAPLPQCLWPPNLAGWWLTLSDFCLPNATQPFGNMALRGHVKNQNHNISINIVPMANKIGRMVTNFERLPPIMILYPLVTWSCEIIWQTTKHYISTTLVPMITKLGRMVTNFQGLLTLMLLHPLVPWSWEITWQTKTISSLPQCP